MKCLAGNVKLDMTEAEDFTIVGRLEIAGRDV